METLRDSASLASRIRFPTGTLGFKVIKSLLAQLDGRIIVISNEPKGATIQLDVPLDADPCDTPIRGLIFCYKGACLINPQWPNLI